MELFELFTNEAFVGWCSWSMVESLVPRGKRNSEVQDMLIFHALLWGVNSSFTTAELQKIKYKEKINLIFRSN